MSPGRPGRPGRFFTWSEWERASSAPLTGADRDAIERLCRDILDPMRLKFGACTLHSAKRSRARNDQVGGAPASYHRYDLRPGHAAADVSFARGTPRAWAKYAARLGVLWTGDYPGHVHVDTRRA